MKKVFWDYRETIDACVSFAALVVAVLALVALFIWIVTDDCDFEVIMEFNFISGICIMVADELYLAVCKIIDLVYCRKYVKTKIKKHFSN